MPRRVWNDSTVGPMVALERAYHRSPVLIQHAMATAFGLRERALRYGGQFRSFCDELERDQWSSREVLAERQAARLRAMVSFSQDRVPYYRRLFADLQLSASDIRTPADLAVLPILDKEEVRADPSSFQPVGLHERVIEQTTGGTTGSPLRYLVTASAVQYNYAAYEVRFRKWAGVAFGDRLASINGRKIVPIEQMQPPFWRHNLAFNQLYLSAYHLTEENLPAYITRLERYRPEVIVGYTSSVHLLAQHINRRGLIGVVCPRAVLVSSETLFPGARADIERAFGCKVFDGYGLGELVALITECSHGSLHVSPEYGVVEAVELNGEHRLVATGLFNQAMPLLRYDTGDVVSLGDPAERCRCGRQLPVIDRLLGRADDFVVTPDGRSIGPAALSLAFQAVAGIREAQIRQEAASDVVIALVADPGFDDGQQRCLDQELRDRLGADLQISYERVATIPRTAGGKRRLVESRVRRQGEGRA